MAPRLKRITRRLAAGAALLVAALAAAGTVGVPVDASAWRAPLAARIGEALGRPVALDGPLRLVIGFSPRLRAQVVRLPNPPGFPAADLLRVGELSLHADLLPLLSGELRVRELALRDLELRLERDAAGRGNWAAEPGAADRRDAGAARQVRPLDLQRVAVERAAVHIRAGEAPFRFDIATLTGNARRGHPLQLDLTGAVNGGRELALSLRGAAPEGLAGPAPWRFALEGRVGAATLKGEGAIAEFAAAPRVGLQFEARAPDAGAFATPAVAPRLAGPAELAGVLEAGAGGIALRGLRGHLGDTAFTGELALETAGDRPRLSGALELPRIDAAPFPARGREAPRTLAELLRENAGRKVDLRAPAAVDLDLRVAVGEWVNLPGGVRDATLRLLSDGARVSVPLAATVAGARFEGEVVSLGPGAPGLRARLATRDAPLAGLAELLFGARHIDGRVDGFEAVLDAEGQTVGELLDSLTLDAVMQNARYSYGNYEGGAPVQMRLERAELRQDRGGALTGSARGALLAKAFSGEFRADPLARAVARGRSGFALDARAEGVRARLEGELAPPAEGDGPDVRFDVKAVRARDLAPWLGLAADGDAPVELRGRVQAQAERQAFTGVSVRIGRSDARLDLVRTLAGGRPLLGVRLDAGALHVRELGRTLNAAPEKELRAAADLPILPYRLDLADSDLDLRVARLEELPVAVADARFRGRAREGVLTLGSVALKAAGTPLTGALKFDGRGAEPEASLWLAGEDVDVDAMLEALRVTRNIDAGAGRLALHARLRGRRLGEVLERSSLAADVEAGRFVLRDRNTGAALPVSIERGELRGEPGAPLVATFAGSVRGVPGTLRVETGGLRQFLDPDERLPFALEASGGELRLRVSGDAAPRLDRPDVNLALDFAGARIDALQPFALAALPPWGPFALSGTLRLSESGYEARNVALSVGASRIGGDIRLDTAGARPRLTAALQAEEIQLENFRYGAWSPFEARPRSDRRSRATLISEGAADVTARAEALVSGPVLTAVDADVSVVAKRVLSGADAIGSGRLRATVDQGRAVIGPVEVVAEDGGSARLELVFEPGEQGLSTETRIRVNRFDYGFILRRAQPGTTATGRFSLNVDVTGVAPRPDDVLRRGRGRIDFAVWPERQHARVLDFWVTNVLFAIIPIIRDAESALNCVVGHFDVADGLVDPVYLVIDTTNTRGRARGVIDLVEERIDLRVEPRAKVPRVFSLATPFHVTGSLEQWGIEVRTADKLRTIALWPVTPVVVPIQRLTGTPPPADGSDVCVDVGRKAGRGDGPS
jgi:uncharacterized protein involved in outer membrane biogenesis